MAGEPCEALESIRPRSEAELSRFPLKFALFRFLRGETDAEVGVFLIARGSVGGGRAKLPDATFDVETTGLGRKLSLRCRSRAPGLLSVHIEQYRR